MTCFVGSTEAPLREVTVVGDHRSDGRLLEASACLQQKEHTWTNTHSQRAWLSVCHPEAELRGACARFGAVWVKNVSYDGEQSREP